MFFHPSKQGGAKKKKKLKRPHTETSHKIHVTAFLLAVTVEKNASQQVDMKVNENSTVTTNARGANIDTAAQVSTLLAGLKSHIHTVHI